MYAYIVIKSQIPGTEGNRNAGKENEDGDKQPYRQTNRQTRVDLEADPSTAFTAMYSKFRQS